MRRRFSSLTGFVLAGGASRRMGREKSSLRIGGETMLERQVRLLRLVCRWVGVLGPPARFPGLKVPVFPDEICDRGPLGGLYTGLLRTRTDFNLFLSCDLPFMDAGFLRYLCQRAFKSRADVTVPESRCHKFEPLCAVYRRRALGAVRGSLEQGENKITRFFSRVSCEVISWQEMGRAGFEPRIFVNMNTREDYEDVKRRLSAVFGK